MLARLTTTLIVFGFFCVGVQAEQVDSPAVADDGREVVLNPDGTWRYKTDDRFATRPDGTRVRLSPDGRWHPIEDHTTDVQLVPIRTLSSPDDRITQDNVEYVLRKVVIESVRTSVQKNTRLRSQIVIHLSTDPQVAVTVEQLEVWDSRGRQYPVQSMVQTSENLQVIAKGAPRWWGVKFIEVRLGSDIELRKAMTEIQKLDLNQLTVH